MPTRLLPVARLGSHPPLVGLFLLLAACARPSAAAGPLADLLPVPAATLRMGCDPGRDPSCSEEEQPQITVQISAFAIDRTEVSQRAYAGCVAHGACTLPSDGFDPDRTPRQPVTFVTWAQAEAFCRWRGARLPSEAEWELAARGTDGRRYPWGDQAPTCETAHTSACGKGPAPVGGRSKGASPFGILDMAGNADEWVADRYARYGAQAGTGQRVARGGAWDAWHCRSTARSALQPDHKAADLGFRCARSP